MTKAAEDTTLQKKKTNTIHNTRNNRCTEVLYRFEIDMT